MSASERAGAGTPERVPTPSGSNTSEGTRRSGYLAGAVDRFVADRDQILGGHDRSAPTSCRTDRDGWAVRLLAVELENVRSADTRVADAVEPAVLLAERVLLATVVADRNVLVEACHGLAAASRLVAHHIRTVGASFEAAVVEAERLLIGRVVASRSEAA